MKIDPNIKNVKLKDYSIFEENRFLYLKMVYEYETTNGIHELHIPKISLGIDVIGLPNLLTEHESGFMVPDSYVDFGTHKFPLRMARFKFRDKFGELHEPKSIFADVLVKENVVEMTLDDIEKKLGHKIKIINKED